MVQILELRGVEQQTKRPEPPRPHQAVLRLRLRLRLRLVPPLPQRPRRMQTLRCQRFKSRTKRQERSLPRGSRAARTRW